MRLEIKGAANFLTNLLRLSNTLNAQQLELFRVKLEDTLRHHYQQHWFPDKPCKGSGYRCLRINHHKMDPIIAKTGEGCGLDEASLRHMFPNELTLWIDPREVSYRIGENGSICVLYDGNEAYSENRWQERVNNSSNNGNLQPVNYDRLPRPTCKESMRGSGAWDSFIMDPRNMNLEQLAAYVSS